MTFFCLCFVHNPVLPRKIAAIIEKNDHDILQHHQFESST